MAKKKLTPNQQAYKQQIKRIRSNLSKLKKLGYDVKELYDKYAYDLPSRVTKGILNTLKKVTPNKLRDIVYRQTHNYATVDLTDIMPKPVETEETQEFKPAITHDTTPTMSIEEAEKDALQSADTWGYGTFEDTSEFQANDKINEEIESISEDEVDLENTVVEYQVDIEHGKVLGINWSGVVVEEHDLLVEETDDTVMYIDYDTGEIIKTEPRSYYNSPDMTEVAIEYLRDICLNFSPQVAAPLQEAIDYLLENYSPADVADAFGQTINGNPNMLERLSNAKEKYNAVLEMFGELAERLDIPSGVRERLREILTRVSMSDMEEYL